MANNSPKKIVEIQKKSTNHSVI